MDVPTITLIKATIWMLFVALPIVWQTMLPSSALRRAMDRSQYAFMSGRSAERWEFPSRAVALLVPAGIIVSGAGVCVWVYYFPPYALPLTPEEQRSSAVILSWLSGAIFGFLAFAGLCHARLEFTYEGITSPSPRRFLRGKLLWREPAECRVDLAKDIITVTTPGETVMMSLQESEVFCAAAMRFGGKTHPIAVALQRASTERVGQRKKK